MATFTLDWLGASTAAHMRIIKIPVGNTGRLYTVEARGYTYSASFSPWPGYDQKFQPFLGRDGGQGVVIHSIDPSRPNEAHVIDADQNGNTAMPAPTPARRDLHRRGRPGHHPVLSKSASGFTVQVSNGAALDAPDDVTSPALRTATPRPCIHSTPPCCPRSDRPVTYTDRHRPGCGRRSQGRLQQHRHLLLQDAGLQTVTVEAANALGSATDLYPSGCSDQVRRSPSAPRT